jgi:hypothetical protein
LLPWWICASLWVVVSLLGWAAIASSLLLVFGVL